MIFLMSEQKQSEMKKIVSDIGKYNIEEYVKAIIRVKKMYSYAVLRNMNIVLAIDHKERLCVRGMVNGDGVKPFDELIPLYKYSGFFFTGTKKKGFTSLEEPSYERAKVYFIKNGVRERITNFESWISDFEFFQQIPDEYSLQQAYRWLK